MSSTLFREVEVEGRILDVRVRDGLVDRVAPHLAVEDASGSVELVEIVEGDSGALLPGLHDHHVHLLALAAHLASVDLSEVDDEAALAEAVDAGPRVGGWVRATGYHESIAGELDRTRLDRIAGDVPLRVQHRTGALWMLNSAALDRVAAQLDHSPDVERDDSGRPTGRLWRYDARLRPGLPDVPPDLAPVGRLLAGLGITGVTDATPALEPGAIELLGDAHATGTLPQSILLLGAQTDAALPSGLRVGPRKLLLHDHDLPTYDDLAATVRATHDEGRAVAVHCVTRHSLVLTLAVLEDVGVLPGDRIEHASIAGPDVAAWMAALGVRVVTQPDFLRTRGHDYRREVDSGDLPDLYPHARLLSAGVRVASSSDAPYGALDPWQAIATASKRPLSPEESVAPAEALAGYLSAPLDPGGRPRQVAPGAPADLVLLTRPLTEALLDPHADLVRSTWVGGRRITP